MASLGQYLDAAARAVTQQNGAALATLLSSANGDALRTVGDALRANRGLNLGTLCEQKVGLALFTTFFCSPTPVDGQPLWSTPGPH
jgi:hypothetical protein